MGFKDNRDYKIRVCGKDSIPLRVNLLETPCSKGLVRDSIGLIVDSITNILRTPCSVGLIREYNKYIRDTL